MTTVTRETFGRKLQEGNWEALTDINSSGRCEVRNCRTGKRFQVLISNYRSSRESEVRNILRQIKALGQLDDRREYDVQDLELAYRLDRSEATKLYNLIQAEFPTETDGFTFADERFSRRWQS